MPIGDLVEEYRKQQEPAATQATPNAPIPEQPQEGFMARLWRLLTTGSAEPLSTGIEAVQQRLGPDFRSAQPAPIQEMDFGRGLSTLFAPIDVAKAATAEFWRQGSFNPREGWSAASQAIRENMAKAFAPDLGQAYTPGQFGREMFPNHPTLGAFAGRTLEVITDPVFYTIPISIGEEATVGIGRLATKPAARTATTRLMDSLVEQARTVEGTGQMGRAGAEAQAMFWSRAAERVMQTVQQRVDEAILRAENKLSVRALAAREPKAIEIAQQTAAQAAREAVPGLSEETAQAFGRTFTRALQDEVSPTLRYAGRRVWGPASRQTVTQYDWDMGPSAMVSGMGRSAMGPIKPVGAAAQMGAPESLARTYDFTKPLTRIEQILERATSTLSKTDELAARAAMQIPAIPAEGLADAARVFRESSIANIDAAISETAQQIAAVERLLAGASAVPEVAPEAAPPPAPPEVVAKVTSEPLSTSQLVQPSALSAGLPQNIYGAEATQQNIFGETETVRGPARQFRQRDLLEEGLAIPEAAQPGQAQMFPAEAAQEPSIGIEGVATGPSQPAPPVEAPTPLPGTEGTLADQIAAGMQEAATLRRVLRQSGIPWASIKPKKVARSRARYTKVEEQRRRRIWREMKKPGTGRLDTNDPYFWRIESTIWKDLDEAVAYFARHGTNWPSGKQYRGISHQKKEHSIEILPSLLQHAGVSHDPKTGELVFSGMSGAEGSMEWGVGGGSMVEIWDQMGEDYVASIEGAEVEHAHEQNLARLDEIEREIQKNVDEMLAEAAKEGYSQEEVEALRSGLQANFEAMYSDELPDLRRWTAEWEAGREERAAQAEREEAEAKKAEGRERMAPAQRRLSFLRKDPRTMSQKELDRRNRLLQDELGILRAAAERHAVELPPEPEPVPQVKEVAEAVAKTMSEAGITLTESMGLRLQQIQARMLKNRLKSLKAKRKAVATAPIERTMADLMTASLRAQHARTLAEPYEHRRFFAAAADLVAPLRALPNWEQHEIKNLLIAVNSRRARYGAYYERNMRPFSEQERSAIYAVANALGHEVITPFANIQAGESLGLKTEEQQLALLLVIATSRIQRVGDLVDELGNVDEAKLGKRNAHWLDMWQSMQRALDMYRDLHQLVQDDFDALMEMKGLPQRFGQIQDYMPQFRLSLEEMEHAVADLSSEQQRELRRQRTQAEAIATAKERKDATYLHAFAHQAMSILGLTTMSERLAQPALTADFFTPRGEVKAEVVQRLLPAMSADFQHESLMTMYSSIHLQRLLYEHVRAWFPSLSEITQAYGAEATRILHRTGWDAFRPGRAVAQGLEDRLLPPEAQRALHYIYLTGALAPRASILASYARTYYRTPQMWVLMNPGFLLANVMEQVFRVAWSGLAAQPGAVIRAMPWAARALATSVVQDYAKIPARSLAERTRLKTAKIIDTLCKVFARDDEQAKEYARLLEKFGVVTSGYNEEKRKSLRDMLQRARGKTLRAEGLRDAIDVYAELFFGADDIGRTLTFLGQMEAGESPEASRAILRDTTVEYAAESSVPVDRLLDAIWFFYKYTRQTWQQMVRMAKIHPGWAAMLAEFIRNEKNWMGYDDEYELVLDAGEPKWSKSNYDYIRTPWRSFPLNLLDARPPSDSLMAAVDGLWLTDGEMAKLGEAGGIPLGYIVSIRWRVPALEEAANLAQMGTAPVKETLQRLVPLLRVEQTREEGGDWVKALPVVGKWKRTVERAAPGSILEQAPIIGSFMPNTPSAEIVARGLTPKIARRPEWMRGNPRFDETHNVVAISNSRRTRRLATAFGYGSDDAGVERMARAYEAQTLDFYRKLDAGLSRFGVQYRVEKLADYVSRMDLKSLKLWQQVIETKSAQGEPTILTPAEIRAIVASRHEAAVRREVKR